MIYLYTGTPGSGKSLHTARNIKFLLFRKKPVICNFPINLKYVKNPKYYNYIETEKLSPEYLKEFSRNYFKDKKVKEGEITLIIDESQMIFNAREWGKNNRAEWNKFMQVHRHFGYDIILVCQFDTMIDKQIRCLVEYEYVHRKVSNFGWKGIFLCALLLTPHLVMQKKVWYPMKEKVSADYFRASKKYYRLYDTFLTFDNK